VDKRWHSRRIPIKVVWQNRGADGQPLGFRERARGLEHRRLVHTVDAFAQDQSYRARFLELVYACRCSGKGLQRCRLRARVRIRALQWIQEKRHFPSRQSGPLNSHRDAREGCLLEKLSPFHAQIPIPHRWRNCCRTPTTGGPGLCQIDRDSG
jgi:hypothetical protein